MQGYHVDRKAGWDCHGLPVELAVEKELGFTGKERHRGVRRRRVQRPCRESVLRHVDAFERDDRADGLLGRHRRRLPDDGPRRTSSRSGGRSSRSSTRACWSRTTGSRRTARAAAPGCPTTSWRRATRRSSTRRSTSGSRSPPARAPGQAALLVWTTTPWTLVSNTAVAVHPDVDLRRRHRRRPRRWSSPSRCSSTVLGEGWTVAGTRSPARRWSAGPTSGRSSWSTCPDADGGRTSSSSPTTSPPRTAPAWCTSPPRSAPTTSRSAARYGLPVVNPVAPTGTSPTTSRWSAGSSSSTPTPTLVDDLRDARAAVPARAPTSTATRTAGAATPRCSTTRSRPGTSAPPQVKDALLAREREDQLVPRRRSSTAATATGCTTTSTGRCRAAATGARRCRSGAAPRAT